MCENSSISILLGTWRLEDVSCIFIHIFIIPNKPASRVALVAVICGKPAAHKWVALLLIRTIHSAQAARHRRRTSGSRRAITQKVFYFVYYYIYYEPIDSSVPPTHRTRKLVARCKMCANTLVYSTQELFQTLDLHSSAAFPISS